jgi:hypothetical protein
VWGRPWGRHLAVIRPNLLPDPLSRKALGSPRISLNSGLNLPIR